MQVKVEILLATYNSAAYLAPFLESLLDQDHKDFHLIVSDDCSTDETLSILDAYKGRFLHRVKIICRTTQSGSATANFSSLIEISTGDYVFLADHDDVWLPKKISRGLELIRSVEAKVDRHIPILLHGDLTVVDADLNIIAESFWKFKSIEPKYGQHFRSAIMHATVTGCTAVLNKALVERLGPIPPEVIMHDWWINLVAAVFGKVEIDPEPHVLYRIHGNNVSKPQKSTFISILTRWKQFKQAREYVKKRIIQGKTLFTTYKDYMNDNEKMDLCNFYKIEKYNFFYRRIFIIRNNYLPPKIWRKIIILIFI